MDETELMLKELEEFSKEVVNKKQKLNSRVEALVKNKTARDIMRKEVLLREMKQILSKLAVIDDSIVKEFKVEAYEKGNEATTIFEAVNALHCDVKHKNGNMTKWKDDLDSLRQDFRKLGLCFLSQNAELAIKTHPADIVNLRDKYCDAVFYSTQFLNPKQFILNLVQVETSTGSNNMVTIQILHPNKLLMLESLALQNLKISVFDPQAGIDLEQTNALEKLNKKQAILDNEGHISQLNIQLKRQKMFTLVSVKMFETQISQSPKLIEPGNGGDISMVNNSLAVFDNTVAYEGLDSSDMVSLDMTARRILQQQQLNVSSRRASKQPNMSTVTEEASIDVSRPILNTRPRPILKPVLDPPGSASNSPFAPKSRSLASTMKGDVWDGPLNANNDESDPDRLEIDLGRSQGPEATMGLQDFTQTEVDDPHLLLNASKAPSPTSANKTIVPDSCWDEDYKPPVKKTAEADPNTSILPDYTEMEEEDTIWESEASNKEKFSFSDGILETESVLKSHAASSSSTRGAQKCLRAPTNLTFIPHLKIFLITEPSFNRIGVYSSFDSKWVAWMQYPRITVKRNAFKYPTSILFVEKKLYFIEKDQLLITRLEDTNCTWLGTFKGSFHGLAAGDPGSGVIYTILEEDNNSYLLTIKNKQANKIFLSKFEGSSKMRFLAYSNRRIVITDLAQHRILLVETDSNCEISIKMTGYLGSKFGQINRPTGVVFDDNDNVLVCDSANDRLVIYNKELQMIKIMPSEATCSFYKYPHDVVRVGRHVYVVYMNVTKEEGSEVAGVVKYKLKIDGVSVETTPAQSDAE